MGTRRVRSDTPTEQDSFLDIVANLVGILIILIVVVGSQIGESLIHADLPSEELEQARAEYQGLKQQNETLTRETASRANDHKRWEESLVQEQTLSAQRKMERDLLLQQLKMLENQRDQKVARLSQQQTQALELKRELDRTQALNRETEREIAAIQEQRIQEVSKVQHEVIEHYPTPIAKTVFGEEVHFQLRGNQLVYAPLNELVQKLKATWETHAGEIPDGQSMVETIGPVAGFRLQYELVCEARNVSTSNGSFRRSYVSLKQFHLIPVRQSMGEPMERALQDGSEFLRQLGQYSPDRTTVSVWVYPDSYQAFLDLRKQLISQGYQVAVWPLTDDQHISGSPDGLRSSAQ